MNARLNAAQALSGDIGAGSVVVNDYRIQADAIDGGHRLTITRGSEVQTIDVTDGVGISAIEKIGSTGDVDSYRITFTDGSTFDYTVETNAAAHAAAEAARVEAEKSRVSAEAERVAAEEARAKELAGFSGEITQLKDDLVDIGQDFRSDNLININDMVKGGWIENNGSVSYYDGYNCTQFIDVSGHGGERIYFSVNGQDGSGKTARRIAEYDTDKTFIKINKEVSFVDLNMNTAYVRVGIEQINKVKLNFDHGDLEYRDYWEPKLPAIDSKIVQSAGNYLFEVTDFIVEKPLDKPFAYVKFDQLTMIRRYASNIVFSYSGITANLWTVPSHKGTKDCLFVGTNENGADQALVFDTSSMSVKYRGVPAIKNTDIVLAAVKDSPSGSGAKVVGELISYHAFHQQDRYGINDRQFIALPIQASVMNKQTDAINVGDYASFVFAYVGDPHAYPSRKAYANTSLLSAGKTAENMNLDAVYLAGDLIASSNTLTRKEGEASLLICNDDVKSQDRRIVVKGNHDANGHTQESTQQYSWTVPNGAFYRCCLANLEKNPNVVWGSRVDAYYYVDYPERKVRVICLNTSDTGSEITNEGNLKYDSLSVCGLRQAQVSWLVDTAMDMSGKSDWHVAVFMHIAVNSGVTDNYPSVQNASAIDGIFKAFKNGSNYHASYTDNVNTDGLFTIDVQANFATQGATPFIGVFAGHVHNDQLVTDGYTTVTATESLSRGKTNRDNYTYNEIAYDVVNVDRSNRKVYLKRIGYGSDREFSY